jgi:hypothetical protein
MEAYDIETPPELIVRWILDAARSGREPARIYAERTYVSEQLLRPDSAESGDDVDAIVAVGTVEIRPTASTESWLLRVQVEDSLGDRLPEDESAPEGPEEIDLEEFWAEFIAPGRGAAYAQLFIETPAARRQFDRFVARLKRKSERATRRTPC